jgi:hypothetical protein
LWRRVAREATAIADVAVKLRTDERVERSAWSPLADAIRFPLKPEDVSRAGRPADDGIANGLGAWLTELDSDEPRHQRTALMALMSAWLGTGAVTPGVEWNAAQNQPAVSLSVSTLFGGLVLELAVAVAGTAGLALCSNCSLPFIPPRRPSRGQLAGGVGTYCSACRAARAPANKASARWRSRNPDYFRQRRARAKRA